LLGSGWESRGKSCYGVTPKGPQKIREREVWVLQKKEKHSRRKSLRVTTDSSQKRGDYVHITEIPQKKRLWGKKKKSPTSRGEDKAKGPSRLIHESAKGDTSREEPERRRPPWKASRRAVEDGSQVPGEEPVRGSP